VLLAILALLVALVARVHAAPARPVAPIDADVTAAEPDIELDPIADADPELVPELPAPAAGAPVAAPARPAGRVPPISQVVAAAYRAAGLDQSPVASWRWRTRLAGLVPTITVRDGRDATWRDIADPTIGYVSVFTVAATWRLDRLLFDANELRISAIDAARRREKRHLADATIRAYYAFVASAGTLRGDEAAAELDALTDEWFSQALAQPAIARNLRAPAPAGQARTQ
jgi:hypothetical protein